MAISDNIYKLLPTWAQNVSVSVFGLYWYWARFGPGFNKYVQEYKERQDTFTNNDWNNWQLQRLGKVLEIASSRVPMYQEIWNESEKKAASKGILTDLPFLEKNLVRENSKYLIRNDMNPRWVFTFNTSGTSGTPITTYWTVQELRESHAYHEVRGANSAGVSFFFPRSTISGRLVEPNPDSGGPFYRYNLFEHQVYFSAFHISAKTTPIYLEALRKHHVQWMTGYAVSHYLLAQHILNQNLTPPPLRAIITTSEKVTPQMKDVMERAFHCKVYEEYNNVENTFFANACRCGRLHVSPDVGVIEILRPDGSPCEPGEVGEVVATCLFRTYQPLIRYRVGDLAAWDSELCPCGSPMPVIKEVVGRIEDVVVSPDGRQMVRFHGIFVNQPHVVEGQVIQESLDLIRVRVVPTEDFNQLDEIDIKKRIEQRLGASINVVVETVDEIPRTKAGKFKAVISRVNK